MMTSQELRTQVQKLNPCIWCMYKNICKEKTCDRMNAFTTLLWELTDDKRA
jgi:hypothetical protein